MGRRKRRRVDPTDDWQQLELLCVWEEQREYERIRPLVLFGEPVPERAMETGTSERTLYRRIAGFEEDGMESLFGSATPALSWNTAGTPSRATTCRSRRGPQR